MRFANPEFLALLLLFFIPFFLDKNKKRATAFIRFTRGVFFENEKISAKIFFCRALVVLKYSAFALIITALARPQKGVIFDDNSQSGIDIMIALDISTSMSSVDFKPVNRLEAAKNTAADFIKERKRDRIGLVVFSGLAFTQCPLTTDRESLLEFVKKVSVEDINVDGTAIGSALITSVNRLRDAKSKEKIIILITDGNNNMGEVDPVTASKIAGRYGIKIYAVGVGSTEGAVFEVDDIFFGKREVRDNSSGLQEHILKEVAENTGGGYFRATDISSFKEIMKEIDSIEKDEIKVKEFAGYEELYKNFALAALLLLFLIMLLENTYLRKLP